MTIRRLIALVAALALFATACGGGGGEPAVTSAEATAALDAATANIENIKLSPNLAETEMLNVRDGSIVDLSSVVTGDRAVLLWYWAPH